MGKYIRMKEKCFIQAIKEVYFVETKAKAKLKLPSFFLQKETRQL
jgi:hypothetical protein